MGIGGIVDRLHKIGDKIKHSIGRRTRRISNSSVQYLNNLEEERVNTFNTSEVYGAFFKQRNVVSSTPSSKPKQQDSLLKKNDNTMKFPATAVRYGDKDASALKNDNVTSKPWNVNSSINNTTIDKTVRVVVHPPALIQSKIIEADNLKTPKIVHMEPKHQMVIPKISRQNNQLSQIQNMRSVIAEQQTDCHNSQFETRNKQCQTEHFQGIPAKTPELTINKSQEMKSTKYTQATVTASQKISKQQMEISEQFVVNLFESRPSKRWTKIQKKLSSSSKQDDAGIKIVKGGYKEFVKYRKQRDMECLKMAQASKLLEAIKKSGDRDWIDQLLVEKILLEADERINLLNNRIADVNYSRPELLPKYTATIRLSDFKFSFVPDDDNKKYTDFYVLTASHGTNLVVSGFFTPVDFSVTFPEVFSISNVGPDFEIKMKLFSIRLKTSGAKRKSCSCCPRSKLIFKDINTAELEERIVLKSSFKLCGEATITKKHIQEPLLTFTTISDNLKMQPDFLIKLEDLNMDANLSGFLNFGRKINDIVFWENKWCTLKGTTLSIYNEPDCSTSAINIDLRYCLSHTGRDEHCPKKRSFVVSVGNAHDVNTSDQINNYYFAAITNKDFKKWVHTINAVLDGLHEWKN